MKRVEVEVVRNDYVCGVKKYIVETVPAFKAKEQK